MPRRDVELARLGANRLVIASHNAGKLSEFRALFAPLGVKTVSVGEFGLAEPEETGNTFAANARLKARFAARALNIPALSDDSGLTVDALDGDPGVHTAGWAETPDGRDFGLAMNKVWSALERRFAPQPRTAAFVCALCLAWPDGRDLVFEGAVMGRLVWPIRGNQGFGFDPMFQPVGKEQTFGEMDPLEKHAMSHRAVAFSKLLAWLGDA
ncbi:MAG: RdgB/HAM1 family non-canonical purine NTP pyrophosphatase [Paracoccaceae bacterium]